MKFTRETPLRAFEAFAGYGSQSLALKRLKRAFPDFHYEIVGYSDIDARAIKAYDALHNGENIRNYGDISQIDWGQVEDFDLFTYSFPCTDISTAGKQQGLSRGSGTNSSLLWECERAIAAKKPKYLLMENVKALISDKFVNLFHEWLTLLDVKYGYDSFSQVLNAKDYGIPQNRERIFVVSILRGDGNQTFHFPKPLPLEKKLKDVLEQNVDEIYYLPDERVQDIFSNEEEPRRNETPQNDA